MVAALADAVVAVGDLGFAVKTEMHLCLPADKEAQETYF